MCEKLIVILGLQMFTTKYLRLLENWQEKVRLSKCRMFWKNVRVKATIPIKLTVALRNMKNLMSGR